ncbi:hypothetical protein J1N35_034590 [Gossypium stocksii]|uniref:Uncharacterized protein n=1 Tax=Gossypium stocksii TaxID=47602 RepID=A0A9D3USV3_9ROSI|nr:hypothetical protein J1N35_034590 [Gossypium stocksii]
MLSELDYIIKPTNVVSMFQMLAFKIGACLKDNITLVSIKKDGDRGLKIKDGCKVKYEIGNEFLMFTSYGHSYISGTPSLEYPGLIKVAVHRGYQCNPDKRAWGPKLVLDSLKQ